MVTYVVRLTVEGDQEEQSVLARDAAHAIRQAMTLWWHVEPREAVVSARPFVHAAAVGDSATGASYESRRSIA